MWGKSNIPSSSMLMTGMSRLQRESGRAEKTDNISREENEITVNLGKRRDVEWSIPDVGSRCWMMVHTACGSSEVQTTQCE